MDARRSAPAAARNRGPILDVLRSVLPERGLVLEIASGTGEHVAHFAGELPALEWQPTDPNPVALASIAAWTADLSNVRPPFPLDAASDRWPVESADAIVGINMVHISPIAATHGLFRGANRLLAGGGPLYLYGPYRRADVATAPSNEAFDADLRSRNPGWGLRSVEDVAAIAESAGFALEHVVEMPANNLSLIFRRG